MENEAGSACGGLSGIGMEEQKDEEYTGTHDSVVVTPQPPRCPKCGKIMQVQRIDLDSFMLLCGDEDSVRFIPF